VATGEWRPAGQSAEAARHRVRLEPAEAGGQDPGVIGTGTYGTAPLALRPLSGPTVRLCWVCSIGRVSCMCMDSCCDCESAIGLPCAPCRGQGPGAAARSNVQQRARGCILVIHNHAFDATLNSLALPLLKLNNQRQFLIAHAAY
jgi:hypothetical protein